MSLHPSSRRTRGVPKKRGHARLAGLALLALAGCGGGGDNPLGNPETIDNPAQSAGQKLSFAYYQRCINPILLAQLQVEIDGQRSLNTCASSGCHDSVNGAGGALRVTAAAQAVNLADAASTPDAIRATDMYKNFYSAQGSVVPGAPADSRLLTKPQVRGVLHGGGLIFTDPQDPNVKLIQYWIGRPVPEGQDEFSAAAAGMFTPPDVASGACNVQ